MNNFSFDDTGTANHDNEELLAIPNSVAERFWNKVNKSASEHGCWLWTANKDRKGYGYFTAPARGVSPLPAHRVSYALIHGPFLKRLCVLHRCDNPSCVNPHHLFLGTIADNNQDCIRKGRNNIGDRNGSRTMPHRVPRGTRVGGSKLTDEQINEIRELYSRGYKQKEIGRRFGVTQSNVSRVLSGETWRHVAGGMR